MSERTNNWIEELFAPKYTINLNEGQEDVTRQKFNRLLQRINREDTEKIKDVYLRALQIVQHQEEQQAKSTQLKVRYTNSMTQTDVSCFNKDVECDLWTDSEWKVLRENYLQEHEKYLTNSAELKEIQRQYEGICLNMKDTKNECFNKIEQLRKAESQIQRLAEVNSSLRQEIVRIMQQLKRSEKELISEKKNNTEKEKNLRDLTSEYNQLRLHCKMLEAKIQTTSDEIILDSDRKIEELKRDYELEKADLIVQIKALTDNLDEEQRIHKQTKLGLEKLRLFFSHHQQQNHSDEFKPALSKYY